MSLELENTGYDSYRPEWESIKDELILTNITSWLFSIIPANRLCHSSLRNIQYFLFYITIQNLITQMSRLSCNIFLLVKGLHRIYEAGAALNSFHCSVYTLYVFSFLSSSTFPLQPSSVTQCLMHLSALLYCGVNFSFTHVGIIPLKPEGLPGFIWDQKTASSWAELHKCFEGAIMFCRERQRLQNLDWHGS